MDTDGFVLIEAFEFFGIKGNGIFVVFLQRIKVACFLITYRKEAEFRPTALVRADGDPGVPEVLVEPPLPDRGVEFPNIRI